MYEHYSDLCAIKREQNRNKEKNLIFVPFLFGYIMDKTLCKANFGVKHQSIN